MNIFVFRNCFTGAVSGGDMHMSGLLGWIQDVHPDDELFLVFSKNDGQAEVYPEVAQINNITYSSPKVGGSFAIDFMVRAFGAATRVKLPWATERNIAVASSHFLPDVLPVFLKNKQDAVKVVFLYHLVQDMDRPKSINSLLANMQEKLCLALIKRRFDKIIVDNSEVARRLREKGFKKQEILVSSNFINFKPHIAKPYRAKKIDLLFCGRMVKQKGVYDLLAAFELLQQDFPEMSLVMVGTGPELDNLQKIAKVKQLNIKFKGYVDEEEKAKLLADSKLFVFPSYEEGWGIAIAEALSSGTPVVAYDLPVFKEVFRDALHVTHLKHSTQLAQQVKGLMREYSSNPDIYKREQEAILDLAQGFLKEKVASQEYEFITKK